MHFRMGHLHGHVGLGIYRGISIPAARPCVSHSIVDAKHAVETNS